MNAIQTFREWLERKPDDRFARYSLALELKKAGDVEGAFREFAELLTRHPTSGAGHYQHGLLYAELDREDEARLAWQAGLDALAGLTDADSRRSSREIEGALDSL